MIIKIARPLLEMQEVLIDPASIGPNPAYWVFGELGSEKWENMTVMPPGKFGSEYDLTFGHYHSDKQSEIYHIVFGQGVLVLQKGYDPVERVIFVKATAGDQIVIPGEWGHAWINIGKEPLVSVDDRKTPHTSADYDPISQKHGMAYYLIEENNQPKAVPNQNYGNLPQPEWVNASDFHV